MLPDVSNMLTWYQWLILGAVPPAIVALYFLKLKRQPLEVPSTWLWRRSVEDLHVNSIWQRLRRNLLLLLQLLVVTMAILAVLRPGWKVMRLTGSRFIFLIDTSASMQATDVKPSRLDEARRRVGDMLDQMRDGDVAMVISFSDSARVEQEFTDNRQQLRAAVASIRPSCRTTSLADALRLAAGLVNSAQATDRATDAEVAGTKLFVLSDGKFPPVADFDLGNLEPVFVPIGDAAAANVAIVRLSVGRHETKPGQLQVFARLANFSPESTTVLVKLFLDDRPEEIDADRLEIPAGELRGVAFDLGGIQSGILRLEAKPTVPSSATGKPGGDHLKLDDEAMIVVRPASRARVLLITPGNVPLKQALTTRAAAELAEVRIELPDFLKTGDYLGSSDAGAWDLVVFDRAPPARMPHSSTCFIGCTPPLDGWSTKPKVEAPQIIDAEVSHPLMQWIDLGDIHLVAEATPLVAPKGCRVLVDSDGGALVALAARERFEDVVLGFEIVGQRTMADGKPAVVFNTDWPLRVSFTTFVLNLLEYVGSGRDIVAPGAVQPGAVAAVESAPRAGAVQLHTPSGRNVRLAADASGRIGFTATDELGVYRAESGGKSAAQFAVNLADAAESDIRPAANPSIKIGYFEVAGKSDWQAGQREIWRELLLVGLVVLLFEWYIYLRRIY